MVIAGLKSPAGDKHPSLFAGKSMTMGKKVFNILPKQQVFRELFFIKNTFWLLDERQKATRQENFPV